MNPEIKTSVIIPCYNHGEYVQEAVASVQIADNPECEIIIVNDGSNDGLTKKVVSDLASERVSVIHQSNKGLSAARNVGIASAKGEYILLLDADNQIDPQYAIKAAEVLDANQETSIVYSDHYRFGSGLEESVFKVPVFSPYRLLAGNSIDACAVFRKSVIDIIGGFDESGMIGYEDWEFWIRCWSHGFKFHHIQEPLFRYRVEDGSMLSRANEIGNRRKTTTYIINKHRKTYEQNAVGTILFYLDFLMHNEQLVRLRNADIEKLQNDLAQLNEHATALQDSLGLKVQEVALGLAEVVNKEGQIKNLDIQINHLQEILAQKQTEIGLHTAATDRQKAHIQLLEANLIERNRTIAKRENLIGQKTEHLKQLNLQNEVAMRSIQALQQRILDIQNSRAYRIYKQIRHYRNILRSNYSLGKETNFLRKFIFLLSKKGRSIFKRLLAKIFKHLYLWTEERKVYIVEEGELGSSLQPTGDPYNQWLQSHLPTESTLIQYRKEINGFSKQPLFSIIIPVYNPKPDHLRAAIESVQSQVYKNWELCLADDNSAGKEVKKIIKEYQKKDTRIKAVYRKETGHIASASNSALELATGDFVVLMDQDDLLTRDALYHNARVINMHSKVDLIYSDEDKVDENKHHYDPYFKPDWSPDNLLSKNYLGHLSVFRASIFRESGGWRSGFDGSQDHDLVLRFVEQTDAIFHIPRILYHWRVHETSVAANDEAKPYAFIAAKKALTEALVRRGEPGEVNYLDGFRGYTIRYELKQKDEKVSIVIPTKDKADYLKKCIDSILNRSTYKNFEIIVVDNNSSSKEFFELMDLYRADHPEKFRCIRAEIPFNFSSLVNLGAKEATGKYLVLLNNDTEVITPDWLEGMIEQAQRPSIGVVGVKLMFANETIQHAGVVMGLGGVAGHVLVGEPRHGPGYFNYVNLTNNYCAVTAACIMIRKDLYDKVNGFDEEFAVEYNDVDFCLRVKKRGYNNIYVPHVELYHYESISRGHPHATKESYNRHVIEVDKLKERWIDYIENDPCYNPNLTLSAQNFSLRL